MLLTLRRARPDEAAILGDIGYRSWTESAFAVNDAGRVDRERLRAEFRDFFVRHPHTALVAERDGVPLGWGAREQGDHVISDLWVAPEAQGQGIGGRLLEALVTEISAAGHQVAELETLASAEQAIAVYLKHGFRIGWHREKFSATLGYAIDKVGMNKSLSP